MPNTEKMTLDERRKYLKLMSKRYQQAQRQEQGRLLDEMEAVTGLHRKSLVRLLQPGGLERQQRRKQRGRSY
ncbi:MAG: integrase, partial [Chloroflexi bacterium]|nr:integrase [Chloroflexota bacterium]